MGKLKLFPGAGLSVPCERSDWIHFLAPGCGRIKKVKTRQYATHFLRKTIYMENCVVEAVLRQNNYLCWLSLLRISELGGDGDEQAEE